MYCSYKFLKGGAEGGLKVSIGGLKNIGGLQPPQSPPSNTFASDHFFQTYHSNITVFTSADFILIFAVFNSAVFTVTFLLFLSSAFDVYFRQERAQ